MAYCNWQNQEGTRPYIVHRPRQQIQACFCNIMEEGCASTTEVDDVSTLYSGVQQRRVTRWAAAVLRPGVPTCEISPADAQPLSDASQDRDWSPCPCPWLLRVLSILKSDTHAVAASKCHRRLSAGGSPLCPRRKLAFMDEGRELLRHIRLLPTRAKRGYSGESRTEFDATIPDILYSMVEIRASEDWQANPYWSSGTAPFLRERWDPARCWRRRGSWDGYALVLQLC
ncbi:hypothetical protein BDZ45DRAFT_751820 [Acephala macrosclerotiorum]|nr:hypothetical protein BDZ45DRAFT_751820 [Acephala macrosclerotiorum]